MRLIDGLRRAVVAPVAVGLLAMATVPAAGALSVLVEAESYTDGYNIDGASIMSIVCTSASNGYAVDGLDIAGEWIEVKATVPEEACYEFILGYQAPYAEVVGTKVTVFDDGHSTIEGDTAIELLGEGLG